MTPEAERKIVVLMREAQAESRGYADFFGWSTDRDIEEWGVANLLRESLERSGESFFSGVESRGRPNDPPDCEALDTDGNRVAIEITELVDPDAIQAFKQGAVYAWSDWTKERFLAALSERIATKGERHNKLKGGPYKGYVIIIFTDEPMLTIEAVKEFLKGHAFGRPHGVTRAFLLLSYDPSTENYPYVDLDLSA